MTQAVQLFMSVAVEQAGIDYHVVLAQNALQQCLDQPELQSEFICALVKQTSRHTQHRLGVQVKKAARLVSLGTARVVSPAYCLTKKTLIRPLHSFGVAGVLHVYWMVMQIQGAGLGKVGFIFGIKIVENVKYCTA